MQELKRKIKSRSGASITYALLLFLVCTMLSSVIIAAASASAGRMSQAAKTDQRYFAVTSAAELMRDTMHGRTVCVARRVVEVKTETTTFYEGTDEQKTETVTEKQDPEDYIIPDMTLKEILGSDSDGSATAESWAGNYAEFTDVEVRKLADLLNDAAYLSFTWDDPPADDESPTEGDPDQDGADDDDAEEEEEDEDENSTGGRSISLRFDIDDTETGVVIVEEDDDDEIEKNALQVNIDEEITKDAVITLTIRSADDGEKYKLRAVFTPVTKEKKIMNVVTDPTQWDTDEDDNEVMIEKTTTTTVNIKTFTWTLTSIKTVNE